MPVHKTESAVDLHLATDTPAQPTLLPLVVDLDGTLIRSDMLHEAAVQLARTAPWQALLIPVWLAKGKAALKQRLAQRTHADAEFLPYNEALVDWLQEQRRNKRHLVLCTASDALQAQAVAAHCGLFDEVLASDGSTNLGGKHKANALVQRFGRGGFVYAGNSKTDEPVWEEAGRAVVVDAPPSVLARAKAAYDVERVFQSPAPPASTWLRMLRSHQWTKNVLLFVSLFAAHKLGDLHAWHNMLLGFIAFCLCASSVYIANDLLDLPSDRRHPRKRFRPFAAGALQIRTGVVLGPLLALVSLLLAARVGTSFLGWLGVYLVLTWLYSWWLKRIALIDCVTLAALYTLRIVAGAAAAGLALTFWLLAFSGFLFLCLAFVKRFTELQAQEAAGNDKAHGRGYVTADAPLIQSLGIASGYTAVVVLALYLNSDAVLQLYPSAELAWAAVPIMIFWVSWIWLQAHRGEMHDDPLVFALRDGTSLAAGVLFGAALLLGSLERW